MGGDIGVGCRQYDGKYLVHLAYPPRRREVITGGVIPQATISCTL